MGGNKIWKDIKLVRPVVDDIVDRLVKRGAVVEICGSIRRKKTVVGDVDLVVSVPSLKVRDLLAKRPGIAYNLTQKGDKAVNWIIDGIQFDFHYARPEEWGAATLFMTGSGLFNIVMRATAKRQGYLLNEKALWFKGDAIAGKEERQIFDALGVKYLEPWERDMPNENKATYKNTFPEVAL